MTKIDMTGWKMSEHGVPDSVLTVLYQTNKRAKDGQFIWHCKCECGNEKDLVGGEIRRGKIKSCGCKRYELQQKNAGYYYEPGTRFGRLTIIRLLPHNKKGVLDYECQCDCGNIVSVASRDLRRGATNSCGCLRKELHSKAWRKDLTGQKFGKILVLERMNDYGKAIYKCKCDCGKIFTVEGQYLTRSKEPYRSCGCNNKSIGENNIEQILQENNMVYIRDKIYFKDLLNSAGNVMRYDFILLYKDKPYRLIEFDGEQHFHQINRGFMAGEERFNKQVESDKIKNEYALSHNIPLIRIPYKERDHITLEMIIGDKYLVKAA